METWITAMNIGTVLILVSIVVAECIFKMPFAWLNRRLHLERYIIDEYEGDTFEYGRYLVMADRYASLRKSFLSMKMGYRPTEVRVDRFLRRAERKLERARSEKGKVLSAIDVKVLRKMKDDLYSNSLHIDNFVSSDEEMRPNVKRLPSEVILVLALLLGLFAIFSLLNEYAANFPAAIGITFSIHSGEIILRRSRKRIVRILAYFTQMLGIAGVTVFAMPAIVPLWTAIFS